MLSIVIPTLNAARSLPSTMAALLPAGGLASEILVVDGGSSDATTSLAVELGARVLEAPRGRGSQLAVGAAAAHGEWLLFLHADTVVQAGWADAVRAFIAMPGNAQQAAAFAFALDDPRPEARYLERAVAWRCRALGLPYGDQGLLIGRSFYEDLGGYRPLPLMEDVDLVRRIGRGRITFLESVAVTSAARYRSGGYLLRPMRNLACLGMYFFGLPTRMIVWLYR